MKKIALTAMVGMMLISCTKTDVTSMIQPEAPAIEAGRVGEGCEPVTMNVPLLAGQTINSGSVAVTNDGENLTVTYSTIDGWKMTEIHLYVGEYEYAPQNNGGNPQPGKFPYKENFSGGVTEYSKVIPMNTLPECFIVAAHAVVRNGSGNTETGWAQGTGFPGNNWGMYFDYCSSECL
jgi:hypothetical protein